MAENIPNKVVQMPRKKIERLIPLPEVNEKVTEVEARFLITSLPSEIVENIKNGTYRYDYVTQGYVHVVDDKGKKMHRLRKMWNPQEGMRRFVTRKEGEGVERLEGELQIDTKKRFNKVWENAEAVKVEKIRIYIPIDDHGVEREIELDVFLGSLAGLVVAEVEFKDDSGAKEKAEEFRAHKTAWLGTDVTGVDSLGNGQLAKKGLPREQLSQLGWKPLILPEALSLYDVFKSRKEMKKKAA